MPRREQVKEGLTEWQVIASDAPDLEQIVEEVEYALYPPKHEGKIPTYGCVITTASPSGDGIGAVPAELARELADSVSSFAISCNGKRDRVALFDAAHDEELQLINPAKRLGGTLVHRNGKDVVRVFTPKSIHIHEAGEWKVRPYADRVHADVIRAVPQARLATLDGLTTLAFHVLSPSNIGTTLVWWVDGVKDLPQGGTDIAGMGISARQKSHFPAIRSLLRKHDGAVFVSPDGQLLSFGHHLRYSNRSEEIIPKTGGTRHTSAKRFSFDEPRVVIVTVSEDGPVSVFSDGAKVTELDQTRLGATADYLATLAPEREDHIETYISPVTCPNCGKYLEVEVVIVYGWREHETGECPVCDTTVYEKNCWKIIPRLVKQLPK